jgi:hypothetical protein
MTLFHKEKQNIPLVGMWMITPKCRQDLLHREVVNRFMSTVRGMGYGCEFMKDYFECSFTNSLKELGWNKEIQEWTN